MPVYVCVCARVCVCVCVNLASSSLDFKSSFKGISELELIKE